MLKIEDKSKCCGCKACENICPNNCIIAEEDVIGFYYPKVNASKCINCHLCERVCPVLNNKLFDGINYYVGYSKDNKTRNEGSSGGVFGTVAKLVIQQNGIVFGAAFDDEMNLVTSSAENYDDLKSLYKSKYIQCNMKSNYQKIKSELKKDRLILFCSTPCYIQALKNYLMDDYPNLITMDFVCHGVSSQKFFNQSLEWWSKKGKIINEFDFRSKNHNINCSRVFKAITDSGKMTNTYLNDPYYYYYYLDYISFRESCYSCVFATDVRCSDITIGDYHSPIKYFPDINRLDGCSSIICNTEKGNNIINKIKLNRIEVSKQVIVSKNSCLNGPSISKRHREFINDYCNLEYDKLLKKYGYYSLITQIKRGYYKLPFFAQKLLRKYIIKE